jgi:magnesium transporter
VQLDSAFMLYLILDELLAYYEDLDNEVSGEIEVTEERALQDLSEAFLSDLLHFKRYLYALTALTEQHRSIFRAFLRPDFPFVGGEGIDIHFRDLDARLEYLLGSLAGNRDAINTAFDIYVSHVTFRTNQVIKVLTVVSTVLLPITVIVGFFGTSFNGVPLLHSPVGFVVMVAAIVAVLGIALSIFYRGHWL